MITETMKIQQKEKSEWKRRGLTPDEESKRAGMEIRRAELSVRHDELVAEKNAWGLLLKPNPETIRLEGVALMKGEEYRGPIRPERPLDEIERELSVVAAAVGIVEIHIRDLKSLEKQMVRVIKPKK